jgi:hypothetical protein
VFTNSAKNVKVIKGRLCRVMLVNVWFKLNGGLFLKDWMD